jgi:ferredoxin-NADP reductase
MPKKYLFAAFYFLSPFVIIAFQYSNNPERFHSTQAVIAMISGACAYCWLIAQILLISRIRQWEWYFGQDRLYRFHARMAVVCIILIFTHKFIQQSLNGNEANALVGDFAFGIFLFVVVMSFLFMADTFIGRIPVLSRLRFLEKKFIGRYEHILLVHNITIAGIIIVYVHVMAAPQADAESKIIYTVYFAIGALFYLYHKIIRKIILSRTPYSVESIVKESEDLWTLKLVPQIGEVFEFKPGQFGFIRLYCEKIPHEEFFFTFSSEPSHRRYISVMVREIGKYASIIRHVRKGCAALVDAPYGRFSYLNFPWERSVMLIVGGAGIAPALSMIRHMHAQNPHYHVTLIWGMNSQADMIHGEELRKIKKDMPNFNMVPVMYRDEERDGERGIINGEIITRFMLQYKHDKEHTGFYACGPAPMMKIAEIAIESAGVPGRRIHLAKYL